MGEFMSLLGIFTGMASLLAAALWLIAVVTGGPGDEMALEPRDEHD